MARAEFRQGTHSHQSLWPRWPRLGAVVVLGAMLGTGGLASAATITVDSTADETGSPANGTCTLREALIAANTNLAVDSCSAGDPLPTVDTIEVPAGLYLRTIASVLSISEDVVLQGSSLPVIDAQGLGRVVWVASGVSAEIHGMILRGGNQAGNGAGIRNLGSLLISGSVIEDNEAAPGTPDESLGAGIDNSGTLQLQDCTVRGNFMSYMTLLTSRGGGIYNRESASLTITDSTISDNLAVDGIFGLGAGGGGLYNVGTAIVTNTTFSGNTALFQANGAWGGAAFNEFPGTLTLTNVTVSGNVAATAGDGIRADPLSVTATNSVFDDECSAPLFSGGGNVESPGNTCGLTDPSDQVNVTAGQLALGALADNGGPTETHALGPSSVAIDAAVAANCPATDQRGEVRSSPCDAGAYEAQPIVVTDCTTYGPGLGTLQAALALGSPIGFACSGTIVVPEIPIAQDLAISAEGYAVTLSGNGANRIFAMAPGANLEVGHLTLSDGSSSGDGGAILNDGGNLIVSDSVLCDNSATSGLGGAIGQVGVSAATSISNTTLCRNTAGGGGAVGLGSSGSLDISTSSLWQNTALGPGFAGVGGALAILFGGSFTIDNSTVSGNIGPLGAIAVGGGGLTGSITHSTVAFNTNGGIFSTPITLAGTIVANNPGGTDCIPGNIDGGHNLDSDGSCFWTDPSSQSNTDPLLRSLADNGGPTQTHAFFPGSLAIDAGGACAAATDQRGVSRPQATACDVGAFEVDPGCGDGFLNPALGEQCDDGNTADGDCCSATCQFQDALGVGGMPNCCSAGACQTGAGCGAICFTPGAICKQDGGPGTACTCELP